MNKIITAIKSVSRIVQKESNKLLILMDQAIVSGGNFLLGLVLIRFLGLEDYGLFALLWMGVLFALSLHQAYITMPLMTLAVEKDGVAQQQYFQHLWRIQLVGSFGISLVFIGFSQLLNWWGDRN